MRWLFTCILLITFLNSYSQEQTDSSAHWKESLELHGYLKNMQIHSIGQGQWLMDNLVHNRLNFRAYISEQLTLGIESRNRIFSGESVKLNPASYEQQFGMDQGLVDLSFNVFADSNVIMNSTFDRAWLKWEKEDINIRVGRQRINWGINLFWNSHDIFNAYNFANFDYEERPGTDAIKIQKYFNGMNSIQLAVSPSEDPKRWIAGLLYKFNKNGYDYQLLGGWLNRDMVLGAGWAGNIKSSGFKGEISYFHPSYQMDSLGQLSASISTEFMVAGKYYTTVGVLYNSGGVNTINNNTPVGITSIFGATRLSAKNLMPTRYSFLAQQSYSLSGVSTLAIIALYSPVGHLTLFMPSFSYYLSGSWDLSLFLQSYFFNLSQYKNLGNSAFIRLRWSF